MPTTLFDYATVAAPVFRRGLEMGEFGGLGLARVLVLEEAGSGSRLAHILGNAGYASETVSSIDAALAISQSHGADALICAVHDDPRGGVELVRLMRARKPDLPVILVAGEANVATAVAAIRQGAFDYLAKPFKDEALAAVVARAIEFGGLRHENRRLRQQLDVASTAAAFVGESDASKQLIALIRRVAPARSIVLIEGESGTGKELIARMLHYWSRRAEGPFVPINCKAIASGVMESELFGHEKGSFTGAIAGRAGCFERASGGTLFLDEVGEADADFQSKLLRVLEDGEVLRVGASKARKIDVRVVAATNRVLRDEVAGGHFRTDLYYRLNVIPIRMAPLRERRGDILPLARHFLAYHAAEAGRTLRMAPETEQALLAHNWPGNVRELENVIERAVVISGAEMLTVDSLALELPPHEPGASLVEGSMRNGAEDETLQECLDGAARGKIRRALERARGNRVEAAGLLGVDRTTLYRLMKRLGLG
jgi:DNA-binding NtrC family response regulator